MAILLEKGAVEQAREMIGKARKIVIVTHMAPDGDAMGSALAVYHFVSHQPSAFSIQKAVQIIVPNAFPAFFNWMPGVEAIKIYEGNAAVCDKIIAEADLFICTDFNDPKRIGPVGDKMMANGAPKILIDHHLNPQDFASVMFSYPEACSSCEIVYRLVTDDRFADRPLSLIDRFAVGPAEDSLKDLATCIYTGMMTDTGNFSFNSTRCEIYDIVSDLVHAGVEKDAVYNAVFNQYTTDRVRLTGYALYRKMRIYPEYHISLITLSADELDRYHYKVGDTEGLVNMPLQISDVYYSVFMREERAKPGTPKSRIRISFRSQGDRPVNIWANEVFHGGGHANASGGELFGTIDQAVAIFEKTMKKYII